MLSDLDMFTLDSIRLWISKVTQLVNTQKTRKTSTIFWKVTKSEVLAKLDFKLKCDFFPSMKI